MSDHPVADAMRRKLEQAFAPSRLELTDQSARHAGHAGHDPRGESHFKLVMVSPAFAGQSRLARQRLVNQALAEELADRVHALAMKLLAPDEDG